MKIFFYILTLFTSINIYAQKKVLDHDDFDIWNGIQNNSIDSKGDYVMYSLQRGEKDSHLKIKDRNNNLIFDHERTGRSQFTYNSEFAIFTIKAWEDSIKVMKRNKVKKDKMPKDSIGIFNLQKRSIDKIANVKSYKVPKKWSGYIAYTYETSSENDSTKKKMKKKGLENGYPLIIRNLYTGEEDTIPYVTDYTFAEDSEILSYITTGIKDSIKAGVYVNDLKSSESRHIYESHNKTKYFRLALSDSGNNLAFIVDSDSTKSYHRHNELFFWSNSDNKARLLVNTEISPEGYRVSSDGAITFSRDESKLFFGLALPEIYQDTLLLEEEIVNVEVWSYDEPRLYTIQEKQLSSDKKRSYQSVIHLNDEKLIQIATKEFPRALLSDEGNGDYALISTTEPYQLSSQWTGQFSKNDLKVININSGLSRMAIESNPSYSRFSPKGKYAYGYNQVDSTWYTYNIETSKYTELTRGKMFYNELSDYPDFPRSYGLAGWTDDDNSILIYDRYDIWEFNPDNAKSKRLTKGRETKTSFRYIKLDPEERFIDYSEKILMSTFNDLSKNAGYYEYNYKRNNGKNLINGPHRYSRIKKARLNDNIIFTRESFVEFPNILLSDLTFKSQKIISDANPQQKDYNWGTAELVYWTSLDGLPLTGMLIKPENFDPSKKYPMIVNFYEKSSDGIHRHRAPSPGRSTINYSFYTSRGYLIFNPDIHYRVGYPGESAFNCVIPGVTSLIDKGFVDEDNIGVQGHSWGGYQIAYLVTKTDIFKAAESGAPVVNMISAFGGIRWDTGLSRQFQYEHTQSRIGGTPWEYPQRYFENSPIYNMDKINTPILIMHNDADGHVPWYQGIEFFMSLRRLGIPTWLLNYNGGRHWPLKMQNRKDFNIRMQQFFDHYLKGEAKPVWMSRGVPAIEKGINQGYDLIDKNK
tara:strand:+ start:4665 stop:7430 length:2766 start_codon:yes stop_codon:yes gene_type:complete